MKNILNKFNLLKFAGLFIVVFVLWWGLNFALTFVGHAASPIQFINLNSNFSILIFLLTPSLVITVIFIYFKYPKSKKYIYIGIILFVIGIIGKNIPESSSSKKIDICRCLTEPGNTEWSRNNENNCDKLINANIGSSNWKGGMNHLQTTKWNQLKSHCGY